jgi:putative Holliday junction resolvase
LRTGVRLAVDVGSVRIGVARCDPAGILATPLETVKTGRGDVARILALVTEYEAIEVIVGLPTNLSVREGPAAESARAFAVRLARKLPAETVRLYDERFTTVTASAGLRASGKKAKNQRSVIDQTAAAVLLQAAIDKERLTGNPPGEPVKGSP